MIYSHLTYINGINGNNVDLIKKFSKSTTTTKGELR